MMGITFACVLEMCALDTMAPTPLVVGFASSAMTVPVELAAAGAIEVCAAAALADAAPVELVDTLRDA